MKGSQYWRRYFGACRPEDPWGRIMDVLGRPIDNCGPIGEEERRAIHQEAPKFDELSPSVDLLETGIKVIDLICPFAKGGKVGLFGGAGVGKNREHDGIDQQYC